MCKGREFNGTVSSAMELNCSGSRLSSSRKEQQQLLSMLSSSFFASFGALSDDAEAGALGGYIVVKEDGEIVCYHFFDRNLLEDYLFFNTCFDTPSTERHEFGQLYFENGSCFLKLNLQVRFMGCCHLCASFPASPESSLGTR